MRRESCLLMSPCKGWLVGQWQVSWMFWNHHFGPWWPCCLLQCCYCATVIVSHMKEHRVLFKKNCDCSSLHSGWHGRSKGQHFSVHFSSSVLNIFSRFFGNGGMEYGRKLCSKFWQLKETLEVYMVFKVKKMCTHIHHTWSITKTWKIQLQTLQIWCEETQ